MTTAKEFIEYLQTIPPDTKIKVMEEITSGYRTTTKYIDVTLPEKYSDTVFLCGTKLFLGKN